ncbi:hypothetical protein [Planctomicrobium sp. SH664]|uniref:hypothetical protein n=1 Tax=Planctomicrobium sp. SH664 TaxID=3448125 RepID=UPI003F5BC0CD
MIPFQTAVTEGTASKTPIADHQRTANWPNVYCNRTVPCRILMCRELAAGGRREIGLWFCRRPGGGGSRLKSTGGDNRVATMGVIRALAAAECDGSTGWIAAAQRDAAEVP